jgi:hypothetical protein
MRSPACEEDLGDEWLHSQVDIVQGRLVSEFGDRVPATVIASSVDRAHARLADARVRHFLPMLVEREVRRDIWRLSPDSFQDVA